MSRREKLQTHEEASQESSTNEREVFLRDGRTLVVSDQGSDQLVEIRNESGMLEVRIRLTEQGPVLQMESVRLQLKATEAVEIESPTIALKATERLALEGNAVELKAEGEMKVEAEGDVRVVGRTIHLN
ncbi:MAG: hypothetical protein ABI867_25600 [Kofleriaceae bacterium]